MNDNKTYALDFLKFINISPYTYSAYSQKYYHVVTHEKFTPEQIHEKYEKELERRIQEKKVETIKPWEKFK